MHARASPSNLGLIRSILWLKVHRNVLHCVRHLYKCGPRRCGSAALPDHQLAASCSGLGPAPHQSCAVLCRKGALTEAECKTVCTMPVTLPGKRCTVAQSGSVHSVVIISHLGGCPRSSTQRRLTTKCTSEWSITSLKATRTNFARPALSSSPR